MKLIDCHTHTQFSVDSEAALGMCAERADRLGLAAYAVTDHCECNSWYPAEHYSDGDDMHDSYRYKDCFLDSVAAVTALKEKYNGKFNLICGVEMGQPQAAPEATAFINADERVDFIIGSLHQIRGEKDFYYIDYIDLGTDKIYDLLERYFMELNEMCRTNSFDVLGHLTYCLRYMKQRHGIEPDISRFDDIIADSFRTLAQNGKGIEINTSGLRQGFGETFPNLRYTKLFREMGGEIISVGSDAHTAEDIGKNVRDGIEIAKAAGFTRIAYFKKRQPQFIAI